MRVTDLHRKMLEKQIKKLQKEKYETKRNTQRPVILRGDSKCRSLLPFINYHNKINLVFRGGAKINDDFLQRYTLTKISEAQKPLVIIWLGTCELTVKRGKYIHLADNLDDKLQTVVEDYIAYKQQILSVNIHSKIIFMECPFQSILIWNFLKQHPHPGSFKQDQQILEQYITKLNQQIKLINGNQVVPHISQDMVFSIKKSKRAAKYLKNYSLLYDGVHPGKQLSYLWYLRLMRMLSFA